MASTGNEPRTTRNADAVADSDANADDPEARRQSRIAEHWEKEWGPQLSPRRKLFSALFIVVVFFGIVYLAFVSGPR